MLNGRAMFLDAAQSSLDLTSVPQEVLKYRMAFEPTDRALASWREMTNGEQRPPEEIRDALKQIWPEYVQGLGGGAGDAAGFVAYLKNAGQPEQQLLSDLAMLGRTFRYVHLMGLTPAEWARPEDSVISFFRPESVTMEMMKELIRVAEESQ